jgi:hypothetical protein
VIFELVYDLCQFLFASLVVFFQLNSRPQTYPRMKLLLAYPVERCDVLLHSHQIETALGYFPESLIVLRQLVQANYQSRGSVYLQKTSRVKKTLICWFTAVSWNPLGVRILWKRANRKEQYCTEQNPAELSVIHEHILSRRLHIFVGTVYQQSSPSARKIIGD